MDVRITVFNGSPRGRNSNSHRIIEPLLEGAREAGAQTEEVFLIEKDVKQCRGCFSCWGETPGRCIINDDMAALIDLYLGSDYVGMATPVYGMLMTGLLKNFTDRFLPLATPHIRRNEDGSFYHEGRIRHFPKQFFIANSGFPGGHNFELLKAYQEIAKQAGASDIVLEIYRNTGEALGESSDRHPDLMRNIAAFNEALKQAGREMVSTGQVSRDTVDRLHMPLISDDEYMTLANTEWDEMLGESQ